MIFITIEDLHGKISEPVLNQITGGDNTQIDKAELTAKGIINDMLSKMYDLTAEFAKVADERHSNLVLWMIDLSVYQLYARIPDDEIPERVVKDYDDTMKTLVLIATGKKPTTLEPIIDEVGNTKRAFRMGSKSARGHSML